MPWKIPGDDAFHPVTSDSVRAVNGWLFHRPVPCLGHPHAQVITRPDVLTMRHRSEVVRFQPLLNVPAVHACLARAQIVVEARAIDAAGLERQLCVSHGSHTHPAMGRRAVIVQPQIDRSLDFECARLREASQRATGVDGVQVKTIRGGHPR
jgi:hypothetical protein